MVAPKFKNDTSLTRLGDHYQYLIALECCINAESEDEYIYIEQRGDVATEDQSTEVKHHSDKDHKISDRHTDFWKTLKNWVENYDVISSYKKLILLTTSSPSENSIIKDWNSLNNNEKFQKITEIKTKVEQAIENKTEKYTEIKKLIDYIFTFDEKNTQARLLEILDKFFINYDQPIIEDKIKEILKREYFKTYKRKKEFLEDLLAHIWHEGRNNPKDWKIKVSEFNSYAKYKAGLYTSDTSPLPDLYRDEEAETSAFEEYNFVKELRKIDLENQIQNAVNDFYRTQKTALFLTTNDTFFADNLSYYQDSIITTDLKLIKDKCKVEITDTTDDGHKIKQSKTSYFEAMQLPIKEIKGYESNQDFFQRGTIHTIVDSEENDFSWIFED